MAVVSFEVVTFHARGAWPYRDGEMTHSADGTATLANGETVSFTVSRYFVPSAPAGERTSYSLGLYSAARRELTAAKWDALKATIRKAFVGHVRRMAEGPRPAMIEPAKESALVAEYAAAAEAAGDAWHVANAKEAADVLADGGRFDAAAVRAGLAALANPFRDMESDVPDYGQDLTRSQPIGEPVQPTLADIDAAFPGWRERDAADAAEAAEAGLDADSYASPVVMPRVGGFAPTGNLAPIGRAYREGTLDSFMVAAILDWMTPARLARFFARWGAPAAGEGRSHAAR